MLLNIQRVLVFTENGAKIKSIN